jgi:opacity protein-like surface antigen
MRRMALVVVLTLLCCSYAFAQSDDYKKFEFFGGYSLMHFDRATESNNANFTALLESKEVLNGFNVSATYNFHKYVGAVFDYSFHFREDEFTTAFTGPPVTVTGSVDTTLHNILGGIQVKNNAEDGPTFKPFGYGVAGIAVQKVDLESPQLFPAIGVTGISQNETSFALAIGGGVDIRLTDRFDLRAGKVDLNFIRRGDQQFPRAIGGPLVLPSTTQYNVRFGVGIVIH